MSDHKKIFHLIENLLPVWNAIVGNKVWTNGCFDLFHEGHKYSIQKAKDLGSFLLVGLNSDDSVKRLKGAERPIHSVSIRAENLLKLKEVDAILIFDGSTPIDELSILKPDIFAKGADYDIDILPEAKIVKQYGGMVISLPLIKGISTTNRIKTIKKNET